MPLTGMKRKRGSGRQGRRRVKRRLTRLVRAPRDAYMRMKRTFRLENWTPSNTTTNDFWKYYTIRFSDLPNVADYQALFDEYKISAVKFTFRPRYDNFAGNDTTDTVLPGLTNVGATYLHFINDPASRVAPSGTYTAATLNTFLENGNVRSVLANKPVSVYFKPLINDAISQTGASADQFRRVKPGWLTTNTPGTLHCGFHVFAQDINLAANWQNSYDVFVTMYFAVKNLK